MRTLGCILLLIVGIAGANISNAKSNAPRAQDIFSDNDHVLIARFYAEGRKQAKLIIAAQPAATESVVQGIRALGGSVYYRADELGYLRVRLPVAALGSISSIQGIEQVNVWPENQFDIELTGVRVKPIDKQMRLLPAVPDGLPTPSSKTPKVNDFTGVGETGAAQFIAAHPHYDGRGVKIAFFEPIEPDLPYLQRARAIGGSLAPKLIQRRYTTNPMELSAHDRRQEGWASVSSSVVARNGRFSYRGLTYRAPYNGRFAFGISTMRGTWLATYFKNKRHPHGTKYGGPLDFAILWDKARNDVWVDTNQNGNFAQHHAMTDYAVRRDWDIIHLQPDESENFIVFANPAQAPDTCPFIVQTDKHASQVGLFINWDGHSAMVGSSAAASGFYNGAYDGMAPGAQLLAYTQAADYPYFLESMIAAAREGADIMSLQFLVDFPFSRSHVVFNTIVTRMIQRYHTIIVVGADNTGPTMSTLGSPNTADGTFTVGGYTRGRRILVLRGSRVSGDDYIVGYSGRGPRDDGAARPDFLAPTEWLAGTTPLGAPAVLRWRYVLQPGYEIGGGTSQATPTGAGALALLISAAKQAHVPYDAERLRKAIDESARVLAGYQAYEQGAGLIDVSRAWEALRRMSATPQIQAEAPVRSALSGTLPLPNRGVGIYEREGWQPGMTATRHVTFTRTSGPEGDLRFAVRWRQNDGTFTSASSITLPLNQPVSFDVHIAPRAIGAHSAFLDIVDPRSGTLALRQLNTIVAASQFTLLNRFSLAYNGLVAHPGVVHYFVNVPKNTDMFSVSVNIDKADAREFYRIWTGELVDVHMPDGRQPPEDAFHYPFHKGGMYSRAYVHPPPGVWEIAINNDTPGIRYAALRLHAPLPPARYHFSAQSFRVATVRTKSIGLGRYSVEMMNLGAPITPTNTVADLGEMHVRSITVSPEHPRAVVTMNIPPNTKEVRVHVRRRSGSSDAALYLFNCAKNIAGHLAQWVYQGTCEYKASGSVSAGGTVTSALLGAGSGQQPQLEPTPVPGRWVAVIDASRFITSPVTYRVEQVTTSPAFGTVRASVSSALVPTGKTFTAIVRVKSATQNEPYAIPTIAFLQGREVWEQWPVRTTKVLNVTPIVHNEPVPIWLTNIIP
jgi:Subtilase family